ncbi:MAG: hypothetical protein NC833_05080 [Candidatus Omnitrophica bacterium]|nr:hypothetical protein [Candidatus Omnitrophota bacterium]
MEKLEKYKKILIFLNILYFFLILPCESPVMYPMFIDSGYYAYTAQRIKEGKILYKEIWEAKFPAIYYIYTFLFTLFPESRWTLYFTDITLTILFLLILYLIFKQYNLQNEYILLIPFLLTVYRVYPSYSGGNLNEHYFIFFFFLTYYFLIKSNPSKLYMFFIGLTSTISCLFKQNLIFFTLFLLLFFIQKINKDIKFFIIGSFIPLIFFIYVMLKGYPESIDCTIFYPIFWGKENPKSFYKFILDLKFHLLYGPFLQMIILFILSLFYIKNTKFKKEIFSFSFIPLFILFKTPPSHLHYSIIFFIPIIFSSLHLLINFRYKKFLFITFLLLTLFPIKFIYLRLKHSAKALKIIIIEKDLRNVVNPIAFTIIKHLQDGERFIMNPPDPTIYFYTKTKSSLKFINFDYSISTYYKKELAREIRKNPPDYIYWDKPISEFEGIFSINKDEYILEKVDENFYKFKLK